MIGAHAKAIGESLPSLGNMIEEIIKAPDGVTRAHFVLLVWTDDGVVQHVNNTPREHCALLLAEQIRVWEKGASIPGPAR